MIRETICYYLMCDGCRRRFIPTRGTAAEMAEGYYISKAFMLADAEKAGWGHEVMIYGNVTFYCPVCYKKLAEKGGAV